MTRKASARPVPGLSIVGAAPAKLAGSATDNRALPVSRFAGPSRG